MKRVTISLFLILASAVAIFAQATPKPSQTGLKAGDVAPEFVLNDTDGKKVKLSDFRGKKSVVLAFYVLAFTGG